MGDTEAKSVTGPLLEQRVWKIIVVGDLNTGKTSIIERYCDKHFIEYYRPTTGIDLKKKTINFDNKSIVLNIWDTAGTEKYQSLIQLYYRGAIGLFIIYDVTNLNSLHNLDTWMRNIDDFAPSNVVRILIGAKCDMESNRMVSIEEGKLVAKHFGIPFFEVSSKNNINVDDSFLKMVSMINEMESDNTIKKDFVILEDKLIGSDVDTLSKCNC
ncbi:ras-related protein Rab-13-like [Myzus persicae]|uniref:ras-related protein Rab-13-like n=1 Tax=Myzus persicae TaxID=13164 RepID=UPI000B9345DB|nr:ras-related protein Rab-13-like [Myzus persicae]XP_022179487.1 ras-related protein Rab-13-like [Myzus persicae]XP_022179488.1 ras-related protein Rab-13-like [Myzus persicae]